MWGFCISPQNEYTVSGEYAKTPYIGITEALAVVVLQKMGGEEMECEHSSQIFLDCHSKELGHQGHLASHIPFIHSLELSFSYDVHDLEFL
jgi:hypothetical protein